jgi:glycosidase
MKKFTLSILSTLLFLIAVAQDPPQYGTPFAGVADPRDVNLYQVHTRIFSAAGNFAGVTARLDQIRNLGINTIYLMPHYPMGTDSRASGSPYCIKDFKGVGAEYGSLADLRALVDGAHARGMAVILDFIVNQTSFDHPWITQHPDWYQRDGAGNIIALFPDVAALNMNNTAMRTAMIDAMRYWVFAGNVDGFRFDFANNAPVSFWQAVINNLRGIATHKLLLLAEGDRPENFQAGFDFNFGDKWFWDALRPVSTGTSVAQLQTTTNTEYQFASATQQIVRYTTNHDLVGRNDLPLLPFQVFSNHNGVVANFLVCAYMRGVPFLMSGQEVDFSSFVAYPWYNPKINWGANTGAAADFTKILNFRTSSNAIRRGTMTNYSNTNVCAFTKTSGTEKVAVMVNLRNSSQTFTIPAAMAGTYRDAYGTANITLVSGATQTLGAYQYIVLTNAGAVNVPVTGVTVSPTSASIAAGLTRQLTATVQPANASNQNVSWSSSNNSVATVNSNGLVTAVAPGTATITVTTQDGNRTAPCAVTVTAGTSFTVHFYRPAGWGTGIRIYWWSAQPSGVLADGTWPGVLMTNEGNGWYGYTFTNISSTNLIFNDGANQTADLNRGSTGWYQNGSWFNSNPGTPGPVYYTIRNRWKGTYLFDAGNNVGYGASVANNNYRWEKVAIDANYFWLRNVGTGHYMHIENQTGSVQCTSVTPDWWSSQWSQQSVDATYSRIRNRWQPGNMIHVEGQTGSAQYAGAQDGWHSAHWQLSTTTPASLVVRTQPAIENGQTSFEVFPNPAPGGKFNIRIPGAVNQETVTLTIYDMMGKIVRTRQVTPNSVVRESLPVSGVYYIQLNNQESAIRKKVVIQ